jgi:hypothetical protein
LLKVALNTTTLTLNIFIDWIYAKLFCRHWIYCHQRLKYWYLLLHCSERSIQECCSVN